MSYMETIFKVSFFSQPTCDLPVATVNASAEALVTIIASGASILVTWGSGNNEWGDAHDGRAVTDGLRDIVEDITAVIMERRKLAS